MGRGQLADRQQKLGQFLSKLTKIAEEFNITVLITNQVVSDPGGGRSVCQLYMYKYIVWTLSLSLSLSFSRTLWLIYMCYDTI